MQRRVAEIAPDFAEVKYLARASGITWRTGAKSRSKFVFITFAPQRERMSVYAGWAVQQGFKKWEDLDWTQSHRPEADRKSFRTLLRLDPSALCAQYPEGIFYASDVDSDGGAPEIDMLHGASWAEAIRMATSDPDTWPSIVKFSGLSLSTDIAKIPPPELRRLAELDDAAFGWELWFEFVLCRQPSEKECEQICAPVVLEMHRQFENYLLPTLVRMN